MIKKVYINTDTIVAGCYKVNEGGKIFYVPIDAFNDLPDEFDGIELLVNSEAVIDVDHNVIKCRSTNVGLIEFYLENHPNNAHLGDAEK